MSNLPHPLPPSKTNNLNDAKDTIYLLDFVEVILKNRLMISKAAISAAVLSIFISLCMTNIYSATARILPPQQDSNGLVGMLMGSSNGMGGMAADILGKGTEAEMYVGILKSEAMSDIIIDHFKLMGVYNKKYRIETYKALDKKVDISAGKKDGIISITVLDKDPRRAAAIANSYVDELNKQLIRINISSAAQNRLFLEERIAKAKIELTKAEEVIKEFQSKNKIISVTDQAQAAIAGISQLKTQLVVQEIQLASLQRQFTENSQEVKTVKNSIANLRTQLDKLEGLGSGGAIPRVGAIPELGEQYLRHMRDFKIQETLVELLTKQLEMAKLTEAKNTSSIQSIQTARIPDKKTKPSRDLIVLACTLAAGLIATLYALICEAYNRMQSEEQERWNRILSLIPRPSHLKSLISFTRIKR